MAENEALELKEETHLAVPEETKLVWQKIKMKDDTLECIYEKRMPGGIIHKHTHESNSLVHGDLRASFGLLAKHVAIMADTSESIAIKAALEAGSEFSEIDPELTSDIKVTGIIITGEEDGAGIMIIAQKRIGPKVLNIITPNMKFEEDAFYRWMEDLQIDIHSIEQEAYLYIFEGKAAEKQLSLDFDEPDADHDGQGGGDE